MKHSENVKIYQASRYHGNVKAVYSMIVLLTESVEYQLVSVANDNVLVNNDVIVLLLFPSILARPDDTSSRFRANELPVRQCISITPVLSDSLGPLV